MHGVSCLITEYSCEFGSMKYYALCGFGGVLSCGLTHTAVVPLDLVKCRMQVCIVGMSGFIYILLFAMITF
jgi:solute carrier family 25 phosphate transporter 3